MAELEVRTRLIITAKCATCGEDLLIITPSGQEVFDGGPILKIEPCRNCLDEAEIKGREEGTRPDFDSAGGNIAESLPVARGLRVRRRGIVFQDRRAQRASTVGASTMRRKRRAE